MFGRKTKRIKFLEQGQLELLKRKNELYNENIEYQLKLKKYKEFIKDQEEIIKEQEEITKELKKQNKTLKSKVTKLTNEKNKKIEIAPKVENGNKIIEKHFEKSNQAKELSNGRFI